MGTISELEPYVHQHTGVSHELAGDKVAVGQVISQLCKDFQHSHAESVSGLHSGL